MPDETKPAAKAPPRTFATARIGASAFAHPFAGTRKPVAAFRLSASGRRGFGEALGQGPENSVVLHADDQQPGTAVAFASEERPELVAKVVKADANGLVWEVIS